MEVAFDVNTVAFDVDKILREEKELLTDEMKKALRKPRQARFIFITGAPFSHVPEDLFSIDNTIIFAEHGAVRWTNATGKEIVLDTTPIERIKEKLGIITDDGIQEIDDMGTIIIEGPRSASCTLLFGSPSHYPHKKATADRDIMMGKIKTIIKKESLPVTIFTGKDGIYRWIDLILTSKKETMQRMIDGGLRKCYYLGDAYNDFEAMQLEEIIPVGFPNCIREIIDYAHSHSEGYYSSLLPYKGGVLEFLGKLDKGERS